MSKPRSQEQIEQVLQQIQSELPKAPEGMSQQDFDALCQGIARAVVGAMQAHEQRYHQIGAEFGEVGRPEEE